jgi:competence protein ComGC
VGQSLPPRQAGGQPLHPIYAPLLELLVVAVIIGLLAGLVAPRHFGQIGKSQINTAKAQIDALEKALDQYRLDTGHYPSTELGLDALVKRPANEPNGGSRSSQGRAARPLGQALYLKVAWRERRLRPRLPRQGRRARRQRRERRRHEPLARARSRGAQVHYQLRCRGND